MSVQGRSRCGLTIVELLCAMGVISVAVGLIAPAIARTREAARHIECCDHLRQVGLGLACHEGQHGSLPPGWQDRPSGRTAWGWATAILPWLDQATVADRLQCAGAPDGDLGPKAADLSIFLLLCPSDSASQQFTLYADEDAAHEGFGQTSKSPLVVLPSANYVGVFGTHDPDDRSAHDGDGVFIRDRRVRLAECERGLSSTMLVSERTARKLPSTWVGFALAGEDAAARVVGYADLGPNRDDADECEFDSRHTGHINVLFGDGRVDRVGNSVDRRVYRAQARRRAAPEAVFD
ncbi:MAG: DUF1559 family PulG-like putative transporter [Planctomycetaceae bacterium]